MQRIILYIDLDAFFAAVEQLDNPNLRGKPVIVVGTTSSRGVVSTASYEARLYGVHSAQPAWKARELCPNGFFVKARGRRYRQISAKVYTILTAYSPLVKQLSIDEAVLDITGSAHMHGGPLETGSRLQRHIAEQTGLSCSVGIAPTRLTAKIACELHKPAGLTLVTKPQQDAFLRGLPIGKIPGVGRVMQDKLAAIGISTVGQFRTLSHSYLRRRFGKTGEQLYYRARGMEQEDVFARAARKSLSSETTFAVNTRQRAKLISALRGLCNDLASRLQRESVWANTVEVKVRFADFHTITRSGRLPRPTQRSDELFAHARLLLETRAELGQRAIRLLGVGASKLQENQQLELFASTRDNSLAQAMRHISSRFGAHVLRRGL